MDTNNTVDGQAQQQPLIMQQSKGSNGTLKVVLIVFGILGFLCFVCVIVLAVTGTIASTQLKDQANKLQNIYLTITPASSYDTPTPTSSSSNILGY